MPVSIPPAAAFAWPEGKRAAISLTFDDARLSQVDCGLPILDEYGVKATFYVSLPALKQRLDWWQDALAGGHEIGNHTLTHPCSGNNAFSRSNALEDYTLERIEAELTGANEAIREMLGVTPTTFAYPCGHTFIGRGEEVKSYIPLVARHFLAGRGWLDPRHNAPAFCDLSRLYGYSFDRLTFAQLKDTLEDTLTENGWLILAGHDTGDSGRQTVLADTLHDLCRYLQTGDLWVAPVTEVTRYIIDFRTQQARLKKNNPQMNADEHR